MVKFENETVSVGEEAGLKTKAKGDTGSIVDLAHYDAYVNKVAGLEQVEYKMPRYTTSEMEGRAQQFYKDVSTRRTVRTFSSDTVPANVVEECIRAAGTAPSGAHTQPWHYVCIYNQEDKDAVRKIVQEEESSKLANAPCYVLVFTAPFDVNTQDNTKTDNWYHEASVSISLGIFLCALTNAGLVTVINKPNNCSPALAKLAGRPEHEQLAYLLPIGFPSETATVPKQERKELNKIMTAMN